MKFVLTFLFAGALALAAPINGPTQVTLVNAGDGVNDGAYYVAPYTLGINGKNYAAMCVDFLDDSYIGAKWQANFTDLSPNTTNFGNTYLGNGSQTAQKYEEEAYLYSMIGSNSTAQQRIDIQHAAWGLTDTSFHMDAGALAELKIAQNNYQSAAFQAQLPYYEVVSDMSPRGRQQEFIIENAPEPASIGLFGAGLILSAILMRRFGPRSKADSNCR
jgi:hypothetical protein